MVLIAVVVVLHCNVSPTVGAVHDVTDADARWWRESPYVVSLLCQELKGVFLGGP